MNIQEKELRERQQMMALRKAATDRAARADASRSHEAALKQQSVQGIHKDIRSDIPAAAEITPVTKADNSKPPSSQEMSGDQRAKMIMEASKGLQAATSGNSGQTDSTSAAANMALSTGMSGASIAAMSGASGATIAGAGAAAAGAGVAIGMIQAAAARRQARNALENQKQLKLIDIEDARANRIQNALQSMASNMGQTLRNNQQIRL
jgi:hypothetical protein